LHLGGSKGSKGGRAARRKKEEFTWARESWVEPELLAVLITDSLENLERLVRVQIPLPHHVRIASLPVLVIVWRGRILDLEVETGTKDVWVRCTASSVWCVLVLAARHLVLASLPPLANLRNLAEPSLRVLQPECVAKFHVRLVHHQHAALVTHASAGGGGEKNERRRPMH